MKRGATVPREISHGPKRKKIRECSPLTISNAIREVAQRENLEFLSELATTEDLVKGLEKGLEKIDRLSIQQTSNFIYICNLSITLAKKTGQPYWVSKIQDLKHKVVKKCQELEFPITLIKLDRGVALYRIGNHYKFHDRL